jgi:hypothetical protein
MSRSRYRKIKVHTLAKGWLFAVPATQSIAFFPAVQENKDAELLPWDALLTDDTSLTQFAADMNATSVRIATSCLCFYIESSTKELKAWFDEHFEIVPIADLVAP